MPHTRYTEEGDCCQSSGSNQSSLHEGYRVCCRFFRCLRLSRAYDTMGGRKKSSKKVVKKKKPGLRSVFKCVQCNNEDAVECHM